MLGFKKRTWVIGGVVAALIGTAAVAGMRNYSPEQRVERVTERVASRLDLNDVQETAFSKVANSYVKIRGTAPEFMLDLSKKLKELANDETLTTEEVNELRTQIKAEFDRRADVLIPEFVDFYNTLDESQRAEVVARLDRMGERIEKRISKRSEWLENNQGE